MEEKMRDKLKNTKVLWGAAAFVLPILIFLCVLWQGGFYPFGEKSMLIMDMRDQYVEFFASLREMLFGDDSVFFSWSRSMGGNYWGILTYYVASPLSFITLFFPVEYMPLAIEILTLFKLGLCGCSFFAFGCYLSKRCEGFLAEGKKTEPLLLVLSLCYVFMSYNMVYSLSLMWLDGVILLPLILMGVEKIIDGRKGVFYLVMLALLLISNYYTGYMVGLYTGLYMLFRLFTGISKDNRRDWLKKLLRFTILSLSAIGIAAPVLVGAMKDLMKGKLANGGSGFTFDFSQTNFEFGDLFGKFAGGTYDSITNSGLPSIYCGYLALILAVVFLFLKRIKWREKVGMLVIAGILMFSFYFTSLDTAWHGFQVPNWFPYRYAFLFSFTVLYMACRALFSLPDWKNVQKKWKTMYGVICSILLLAVVSVEMGSNACAMLEGLDGEFHYSTVARYDEFIDGTKPLVDDIKEADNSFYRINQGYEFSKNDAMLLGYHGMTHYSSTYNAAINSLTPRLGVSQAYFWNSGYGSNALLDSLFAVKYILADKPVPNSYKQRKSTEKGTSSYENPLALSIAYGAAPSTMSPDLSSASPFDNQNKYFSAIAGTDVSCFTELLFRLTQNNTSWEYQFTADSGNPVYLYMRAQGPYYANVYVNDAYVGDSFTNETNGTLFLGNFTAGETVKVRVESASNEEVTLIQSQIAELHEETVAPALKKLQENSFQVESQKNGRLEGKISLADGQKIMTSIPYDEGWSVWIDGEKTEAECFADTFMALECPAGEHEIRLSYTSPGVFGGAIISIIALLISILYLSVRQLNQNWRRKTSDNSNPPASSGKG